MASGHILGQEARNRRKRRNHFRSWRRLVNIHFDDKAMFVSHEVPKFAFDQSLTKFEKRISILFDRPPMASNESPLIKDD